ncbi:MAG: DUF58 domain-containing protein [Oscillospiraceae bacterium]|nr:DUF58 domain-containing protein [Oscillospiraceae bacterium]
MTPIWMMVVVAILAVLQTIYYNRFGLRKVSYTRHFSRERVFEGEQVELVEVLSNDKIVPVPWVRVESRISGDLRFRRQENMGLSMDRFHKSLFFMGSYSRITRRHEITCLRRGWYDCSLVSIVAGDLFGVAHDRADVLGDAKLFVYPAILKPEDLPDTALKWQGDVTVKRWILPDPLLVTGIRDYRSGDPLKDVHWGATARTGSLQVKQRDYTVSPRALLVLNCQISERLMGAMEPADVDFLEGGVRICATLAAWCVRNGIDVGFLTNGESRLESVDLRIPPRCSEAQLDRVLEALAVLKIKMSLDLHVLLDRELEAQITGLDILIVSAYWSAVLEERARKLRQLGNSVTWVKIGGGRT